MVRTDYQAPSPLHARLAAAIAERDERTGRRREEHPDPLSLVRSGALAKVRRAWRGRGSLTVADWGLKLLEPDVWPLTPGELARQYIRETLAPFLADNSRMRGRAIPWRRQAAALLSPPPYYFSAPRERGGAWSYLDIQACHANLYLRRSPVVVYRPHFDPPVLSSVGPAWLAPSEWLIDKAAYCAAWGTMRASHGPTELRRGVAAARSAPNRYFAPDAAAVVLDTLHAVASECRLAAPSLAMWAVDGCIVRPDDAGAVVEVCRRWGLTMTERCSGPGWLWALNSWRIGLDEAGRRPHIAGNAVDTIRPVAPAVSELLMQSPPSPLPRQVAVLPSGEQAPGVG